MVDWRSGNDFNFVRSTDNGWSWSNPIQPADTFYGVSRSTDIERTGDGLLHVAWVGQYEGIFRFHVFHQTSSDGGRNWSNRHQVFNSGSFNTYFPSLASKGDTLFLAVSVGANLTIFHSFDSGLTWQDSTRADTAQNMLDAPLLLYNQGRLHIVYLLGFEETGYDIYYTQSDDFGLSWTSRICLSDSGVPYDASQNPAAYIDERGYLVATWQDYKYGWNCDGTGEVLGKISTDNGETWLPEIRVTQTQSAEDPGCLLLGDTILVAWPDALPLGCFNRKMSIASSMDWGWSWSEPQVITGNSPGYELSPFLFSSEFHGETFVHCLYFGEISTGGVGVHYLRDKSFYSDRKRMPDNNPVFLKIEAWPNVVNSSTLITYENSQGGEAEIEVFDLSGRMVWSRGISGKEGSVIWNAEDKGGAKVCAGIYLVRVRTTEAEKTIKLVLLK
jgi:hypothetical protein